MSTDTTAAVAAREPELPGQIVVAIGGSAGIGLETAIERAVRLYERENRHEAAVPTVLRDWDYSTKSGPGFSTLAAVNIYQAVH